MGDCKSQKPTFQRTGRCKHLHALKYTHAHSFHRHVCESVAINLKCREADLLDCIIPPEKKNVSLMTRKL